jgi:hypothetical protein
MRFSYGCIAEQSNSAHVDAMASLAAPFTIVTVMEPVALERLFINGKFVAVIPPQFAM